MLFGYSAVRLFDYSPVPSLVARSPFCCGAVGLLGPNPVADNRAFTKPAAGTLAGQSGVERRAAQRMRVGERSDLGGRV